MGDTVHHLGNALQAQTSREIAREQLAPLARMLHQQTDPASALAGNTDWLLSDTHNPQSMRALWLDYTGFPESKIVFPTGGLWNEYVFDEMHARLLTPHGHAFDRAQRGDTHRPWPLDYPPLLQELRDPSPAFVKRISDPNGPHAVSTNRMARIGAYVKRLPNPMRSMIADLIGWIIKTQAFEPEFARLIAFSGVREEMRHRCYGLMGHSHLAGIRRHGDVTIVNTGSFGARNIPSQRVSDQKAHVAVLDDEAGTLDLIQTYDPRHPQHRPERTQSLDLHTGRVKRG
jgi:hypothetical protein